MIPLTPKYATMHSVISAWARCGLVDVKASEHRGNRASLLAFDHTLGGYALRLSERVFHGAISPPEIVDFHSHVPLHASFMTALQGFAWREQLLSRTQGRDPIAMGIRRHGLVEAETLRKCPTCVKEDQAKYGCAHWRIFHQWPVARHCVVHGDTLTSRCADCQAPCVRRNEPSLADDPCAVCGSTRLEIEHQDVPTGYWPLLQLLYRALQADAPEVSALVRAHPLLACRPAACSTASSSTRARVSLQKMLSDWNAASVDHLSCRLGAARVWTGDLGHRRSTDQCPLYVQAAALVAEAEPQPSCSESRRSWRIPPPAVGKGGYAATDEGVGPADFAFL
ncbi:MAG: hypothetical protein EKK53_13520 [Burkholderiales bacterium]|nr:MAG: hypothetical protein EKK53_13520 [Burkholderiales bacterium]